MDTRNESGANDERHTRRASAGGREEGAAASPRETRKVDLSSGVLKASLTLNQRLRWSQGERVRVEEYIERDPRLALDKERLLNLIYNEIVLREEAGETPELSEYVARFGELSGDLEQLFEVYRAIGERPRGEPRRTLTASRLTPAPGPVRAEDTDEDFRRMRVADYELLEPLGHGGMGVVYKARQISLQRIVAIKMLRPGLEASSEDQVRFRTEAEAVARLQHPNVVEIHDVGEVDGRPYFALEYVEGGNLEEKLDGKPARPAEAAELVKTLARAVHVAHTHHIVHRDLKPSNVLMTPSGIPKISDFGLSKRLEVDSSLTATGVVMGTPSYMSPEQAWGDNRKVGPPTDVYGLGALLYECLTGTPPFRGQTAPDTLLQVRHDEPVPPIRLQPRLPRDLDTICRKCLEKDPRKRYPSAEALAEDLERFLGGTPIEARPSSLLERGWKWAKRRKAAAAVLLVSALALVTLLVGAFYSNAALRSAAQRERLQAIEAETARQEAVRQRDRAAANLKKAREAVDRLLTNVGQERLAQVPQMEILRRELLEDALEFYNGFLSEQSDDPEIRRETGLAWNRIGQIRLLLGEHRRAEEAYRKGIELLEQLRQEAPGDSLAQRELSAALNDLATVLRDSGELEEAEGLLRESVRRYQLLVEEHPDDPAMVHKLVQALNNLGVFLKNSGRTQEAEQLYRQALGRGESLVSEQSKQLDYRKSLAQLYHNLGTLFWNQKRMKLAEDNLRTALKLEEELLSVATGDIGYLGELGRTAIVLGAVLQSRGKGEEAASAYTRGIEVFSRLKESFPRDPSYREQLGTAYFNLGTLRQFSKQLPEAEELYAKALEERGRLVEELDVTHRAHSNFAVTLNNVAEILRDRGELSEALRKIELAIEHQSRAIETASSLPLYRYYLSHHHKVRLGMLLLGKDHVGAARAVHELIQANPAVADDLVSAAVFLSACIPLAEADESLDAENRKRLASKYRNEALDLLEKAAERGALKHDLTKADRRLDPLRSSPRFRALLEALKEN